MSDSSPQPDPHVARGPLRVAVVVESDVVSEWIAWTVRRIDAMDACRLVAVVRAGQGADPRQSRRRPLAYGLYERFDWLVVRPGGAVPRPRPRALLPRPRAPPPGRA